MAFLRIFFGAGWYLYGPSGQRISQAIVFKYMTNMFQFHAHLGNSGVSSCGSIGPVDIIWYNVISVIYIYIYIETFQQPRGFLMSPQWLQWWLQPDHSQPAAPRISNCISFGTANRTSPWNVAGSWFRDVAGNGESRNRWSNFCVQKRLKKHKILSLLLLLLL